jgi:hypothetical protein
MADTKITALAAITTVDPAADVLPIVDISDTSMAASGTTKKITSNQILGSGGTATLASATITGDLTVDTNVLKVDSANNRVGINFTSPTVPLYVQGSNATATAIMQDETNGAKLRLLANSINFDLSNGGGGGDIAVSGANPLTFRINGSEQMRLNSTGLGVGVTPSGSGGCLQLKSGITFPATQVASSDANTLDDYEEGTWVGTLKGATTDPTIAVTATGRYTKVGRLVSVQISFSNVNTTGASGDAYIIGLPFANSSITVHGSAASYLALTFSGYLGSEADPGGTNISLFDIRSGNVWASAQHSAGTSRYINAELTYTVA